MATSADTTRVPTPVGTITDKEDGVENYYNNKNNNNNADDKKNSSGDERGSLEMAEKADGAPAAGADAPSGEDAIEYPTGAKLAMVVVALVLCTLLVAMDMVGVALWWIAPGCSCCANQ